MEESVTWKWAYPALYATSKPAQPPTIKLKYIEAAYSPVPKLRTRGTWHHILFYAFMLRRVDAQG
jgi:hypothetical protein